MACSEAMFSLWIKALSQLEEPLKLNSGLLNLHKHNQLPIVSMWLKQKNKLK